MRTAFRVPFAVKLWNSWSLFRKEVLSRVWGGASKSSPSLRSVRSPGWGEISIVERYYIKPRTTERAFPFEGEGGAKRRMRAGERC